MTSVQAAKDTFYNALRDRVRAGNAGRSIVVRGTVRPGVVVVENELPGAAIDGIAPADAFCLRWTQTKINRNGALPLIALGCEIRYGTDGSEGHAGMDRGRALAAIDEELSVAVGLAPQAADAIRVAEIAGGGACTQTPTGTRVFWADVVFQPAVMRGERMERTAEVEVFAYGE
jgi:hypothetical protein